jgi:hypothetical protein
VRRKTRAAVALVPLSIVLLIVLFPASAASKGRDEAPSCSSISRKKLAKLAQTGRLKLVHKVGNFCEFNGHKPPDHYVPTFEIELVPYSKKIWKEEKADAKSSASKTGSDYGQVNSRMFFVSGKFTDKGDPPCVKSYGKPGKGQSKYAPVCTPEPAASHIAVYGNGTDTRTHMHLLVSGAVTAEEGEVHLSHMIELVKEVISGKIH